MIRPVVGRRGLDLFEGLRRDRRDALRVDQIALHSSLFTLHSPLFIHFSPRRAAVPYDGAAHTGETGVLQESGQNRPRLSGSKGRDSGSRQIISAISLPLMGPWVYPSMA